MKKTVSFMLAFVMIAFLFSFSVGASPVQRTLPVIYVHGYGTPLVMKQKDGSETPVYPAVDTDGLRSLLKENKAIIAKALLTQDWSDFDDLLVEYMADSYKDLLCDGNGNSINDIRADVDYSDEWMKTQAKNYQTDIEAFTYEYDFRLDPYDQMDALKSYVERVQKATGQREYAMVGRCLGANLVLTFMDYYHDPNLKKVAFYIPAFQGASPVSEAFSGDMTVTAEGVERLICQKERSDNTTPVTIGKEVICEIARIATDLYGLDYAVWTVNNVFSKTYKDVLPRMMRASMGTFPGYWAMVDDMHYNNAKRLVFDGYEDAYAGLIEKTDRFHYNVMNRAESIINEARNSGVYVANVVKYDYSHIPLGTGQNKLSDSSVFTANASLGATCADTGKTLSDAYLEQAKRDGNRYLSPDKKIDASTCLLPDATWFVKNSEHGDVPSDLNRLFEMIFSKPGFTVFDDESFPQFLYYNKDTQTISQLRSQHKSGVDIWSETTNTPIRRLKKHSAFLFEAVTSGTVKTYAQICLQSMKMK